jgi:hypothetical protein
LAAADRDSAAKPAALITMWAEGQSVAIPR